MKPSEDAAQKMYKIFEKTAIRIAGEQKKNSDNMRSPKEEMDGEKE